MPNGILNCSGCVRATDGEVSHSYMIAIRGRTFVCNCEVSRSSLAVTVPKSIVGAQIVDSGISAQPIAVPPTNESAPETGSMTVS